MIFFQLETLPSTLWLGVKSLYTVTVNKPPADLEKLPGHLDDLTMMSCSSVRRNQLPPVLLQSCPTHSPERVAGQEDLPLHNKNDVTLRCDLFGVVLFFFFCQKLAFQFPLQVPQYAFYTPKHLDF